MDIEGRSGIDFSVSGPPPAGSEGAGPPNKKQKQVAREAAAPLPSLENTQSAARRLERDFFRLRRPIDPAQPVFDSEPVWRLRREIFRTQAQNCVSLSFSAVIKDACWGSQNPVSGIRLWTHIN